MTIKTYALCTLFWVVVFSSIAQNKPETPAGTRLKPIVQVFGTASYNFENNNFGYSFGRAHFGLQYHFNEKWSAKIILDRGRATSVGSISVTDVNGNILAVSNTSAEGAYYTMYLKFASLKWQVNEKISLEGGAILQNQYITQERFWGLRYVAQTFQDLYWNIPSTDLGFIAFYKINHVLSVDAAITNGEGPRVKQDAFGKLKFAGGIDIIYPEKFQTRIFYHNNQPKAREERTEQLLSVFTGYKPVPRFRLGAEFNYMANLNNIKNLNNFGFSIYPAYQLAQKTELFARYDRLFCELPDNFKTNLRGNGNTVLGGISHSPVKGVNISLNYQGWLPDQTKNENSNIILLSMEYKF